MSSRLSKLKRRWGKRAPSNELPGREPSAEIPRADGPAPDRQSFTTTRKTIAGLVGLLCIIAALAALGYKYTLDFSQNLTTYNRLAFFNVGLSDLRADLNSSAYNAALYYLTRSPQNFEYARDAASRAVKRINSIKNYADDPADQESLAKLDKNLEPLRAALLRMEQASHNSWELAEALNREADEMSANLDNMVKTAKSGENYNLVYALSEINRYLFNTHLNVLKYVNDRAPKVRDAALANMRECEARIGAIAPLLKHSGENYLYAALASSARLYFADVRKIQADSVESSLSLALARNLLSQLLDSASLLNAAVDKRMFDLAYELRGANASAQRRLLAAGVTGLGLGLGLALIIMLGIIRVLGEISDFARQLAAGNFNARIRVREEGKIGQIAESLQRIPEILRNVQTHTDKLATEINRGRFRNRLDERPFSGSFSDIVAAINKVCESYVSTLDTIPSPLFTCDTSLSVLFTNKAGRELTGRSGANTKCYDFFSGKSCHTDNCYGMQALRKDGTYSGEETLFPDGVKMSVQITARSLKDPAGNIVGFLGRILDLTEIRRRELVMFSVAGKAMVIVERLAEAAAQISAQVEQIASGAEEQRKRIHYTAVAMSQMNDAILEVAQNADIAAVRTENTYACAAQGSFLVNQASSEINALYAMNANMDASIKELDTHRTGISNMLAGINQIAAQAINLSRASVSQESQSLPEVMDTIRDLADKNMETVRQLENNVAQVQAALRNHMREVKTVMRRVETATALSQAAEQSLQNIVSLATESASVVSSIASAAEEQSNTSMEIHPVMDSINTIAAEAAENASSVAQSAQNLATIAKDLREIMRTLK